MLQARHLRSILAATFFALSIVHGSLAQSPTTIAGRTLHLNISFGTLPYANAGAYRFLPSATDNWYAVVPLSANVAPSAGTYSYTKTGANTANLAVSDSETGTSTVACIFSSATNGTYVITNPLAPGSQQTGTFKVFSGPAPDSIAGMVFTVTITSGEFPLADSGQYRYITDPSDNTYVVENVVNVADSNGTYTYSRNSPTTGLISVVDSGVGSGASQQLSFDTPTSGTIVWRLSGSNEYQTAIFTMAPSIIGPSIDIHPLSQSLNVADTLVLTVIASGTAPLTFQWMKNGTEMSGQTSASLTITRVTQAASGSYTVRVSNIAGSVTSEPAIITILQLPSVTLQPPLISVPVGTNIVLSPVVTGSAPFTYQWWRNDGDIQGATASTFSIINAQPDQSGSYSVRVSNAAGSVTSSAVAIEIWKIASLGPSVSEISRVQTNTTLRLSDVQPAARYRIQSSTDLTFWSEIHTFIGTEGSYRITNSSSSSQRDFYRVISP